MASITKHPGLRGLGFGLSALWLILAVVVLLIVGRPSDAGELGSFLEGAAAPVALLWLILGFVAQTKELSQRAQEQTEAMETARQQVEETQNQTGFQNIRELFFTYLDDANRLRKQLQEEAPGDEAYVLIRGLQRVALAAYTGGLNLSFLLASNGPQFVRTWMKYWNHTREDVRKSADHTDSTKVPFSRRHAE